MEQKQYYFDYAATTPVRQEVLDAMQPWYARHFANPSSVHSQGQVVRRGLDDARARIAALLNCAPQELVFTSSGTESTNLALLGAARAKGSGHVVTVNTEHVAVLDPLKQLEKEGFEVTELHVDETGHITTEQLLSALQENTILVSVMMVNNEIGVVHDIAALSAAVKKEHPDVLFHTDACQAAGVYNLDTQALGVDLLSLSGSKVYGPTGSGLVFIKSGTKIQPLQFGGGQEFELRPGTEDVAHAVGLATALELSHAEQTAENVRLAGLRDRLWSGIEAQVEHVRRNGAGELAPHILNVHFERIDGESLLFALDQEGFAASIGSACGAGSIDPSHVVMALGLTSPEAKASIRFSLGHSTTEESVDALIATLWRLVKEMRK